MSRRIAPFIGAALLLPAVAAATPGDTELVSMNHGAPIVSGAPNGPTSGTGISADGRFVAFTSSATNFVDGDTNGVSDVFVYDRASGEIERVSVSSRGEQADGISLGAEISPDGRFVVFTSFAGNLVDVPTGAGNVYVHDRSTGVTSLVSVGIGGRGAGGTSRGGSISADGRFVAFSSIGINLVPGPPPFDSKNPRDLVYVRDLELGTTVRISENSAGEPANGASYIPLISDNGRWVVFASPQPTSSPVPAGASTTCSCTTWNRARSPVSPRATPARAVTAIRVRSQSAATAAT